MRGVKNQTKRSTTKPLKSKKKKIQKQTSNRKEDPGYLAQKNPAPVLEINLKGQVITANPSAEKLFPKNTRKVQIEKILEKINQTKEKEPQIEEIIKDQTFLFTTKKNGKTIILYASNITNLKKAQEECDKKIAELEEFHELIGGREERMIELKKEVNTLLRKLKKKEKYTLPKKYSEEVKQ